MDKGKQRAIQTNWNLSWDEVSKLHHEVEILSRRFNDDFDWRILTRPINCNFLPKAFSNKQFMKFLKPRLNITDNMLIQLYRKNKALRLYDLGTGTSANLMYLKNHNYVDRIDHYNYKINNIGINNLEAKFYPYWCKYKKELLPIQRIVIYRLAIFNNTIPTQKLFAKKLGTNQGLITFYERGGISPTHDAVTRSCTAKKLMKKIKQNFENNIGQKLDKRRIKETYKILGRNRYNQICHAAKQIHPRLKEKLTKQEYRIYQTKRIKNTKPSIYERRVINKFKKTKISEFEIHPFIETYHFDFAIPSEEKPKAVMEVIIDWYDAQKVNILRKKLTSTVFIAVVNNEMRFGYI